MTFKEFMVWCNDRACDGLWSLREVMEVLDIVSDVMKTRPWRREKYWKKRYESRVMQQIVIPLNKRIEEFYERGQTND